jgi:pSer/pThr/pTyr-binding forkhead associated (FHA) protein
MLIGRQGVLVIRDLNSTNHTYLNEQRVNGMVQVPNGSVIRVGRTSMRVRYAYR